MKTDHKEEVFQSKPLFISLLKSSALPTRRNSAPFSTCFVVSSSFAQGFLNIQKHLQPDPWVSLSLPDMHLPTSSFKLSDQHVTAVVHSPNRRRFAENLTLCLALFCSIYAYMQRVLERLEAGRYIDCGQCGTYNLAMIVKAFMNHFVL